MHFITLTYRGLSSICVNSSSGCSSYCERACHPTGDVYWFLGNIVTTPIFRDTRASFVAEGSEAYSSTACAHTAAWYRKVTYRLPAHLHGLSLRAFLRSMSHRISARTSCSGTSSDLCGLACGSARHSETGSIFHTLCKSRASHLCGSFCGRSALLSDWIFSRRCCTRTASRPCGFSHERSALTSGRIASRRCCTNTASHLCGAAGV